MAAKMAAQTAADMTDAAPGAPPPASGDLLHRLPRETLLGYACIACLAVVAGTFLIFAGSSYERVIARGEQQARDAAFFFADHGSRLFEATDLATGEAIAAIENESWDTAAASQKTWQALHRLSERFPYVDALFLADQDGMVRQVSATFPVTPYSVVDREYFRVHRDGKPALYVSGLLVSRATDHLGFVLSRRINGPDGEFRGIAATIIDVDYFAEFYRSVNLPYGPVISLFRKDLQLLAQYPPAIIGGTPHVTGAEAIRKAMNAAPGETGAGTNGDGMASGTVTDTEDGREMIIAYAKIANLPLYVSIAIERDALVRVWLEDSRVPGGMAAVALLALGALSVLVFRQARRDERAKRMLESEVEARTADLRTANAQLEILVQEVHHRVKNNLQVISSMLRLQSIQMEDDGVRKALQDSVNRVHAMSLVHEMLSSQGDRTGLEFREYLQDLTDQLKESYGVADRVAITIECEDLNLDMTRSILLALIVNEIFSNALKHGFRDGRHGTLTMSVARQGNRATLTIRDNGAGLPSGFDWRGASSLGLQIVQSLTTKLGGEASLTATGRDAGMTTFLLSFPLRAPGTHGHAEAVGMQVA
ncbi:MAG TPA: histidine kinase dimerization/phosphoacceptor domain -containing protein [Azospirillum sp.]|nr:histidine kinase dimerization/phosphoacceptor domain -containing protein [Azospirillum sp.]